MDDMEHTAPSAYADLVVKTVFALAEPIAADFGLELVEVQFRREATGWVLRVIIDSEAGVSVDDCANVSREVSRILEVEDPIEQSYNLEVSSPGLDRPLKTERDFVRSRGRKVKIITRDPAGGRNEFTGVIEDFADNTVFLDTAEGAEQIPLARIAKAKLLIDF